MFRNESPDADTLSSWGDFGEILGLSLVALAVVLAAFAVARWFKSRRQRH